MFVYVYVSVHVPVPLCVCVCVCVFVSVLHTVIRHVFFLVNSLQDSLRTLVQNSLQQFCDMIHDATYSTLELPEDYEWQGDLNQCVFK